MIAMNKNLSTTLKHHCDSKMDLYRKMLQDLLRKQEKHVSFDGSINVNNNNSTTINSSSSSSTSSTPQQSHHHRALHSNEHVITKKSLGKKYKHIELRDIERKRIVCRAFSCRGCGEQ